MVKKTNSVTNGKRQTRNARRGKTIPAGGNARQGTGRVARELEQERDPAAAEMGSYQYAYYFGLESATDLITAVGKLKDTDGFILAFTRGFRAAAVKLAMEASLKEVMFAGAWECTLKDVMESIAASASMYGSGFRDDLIRFFDEEPNS